MMHVIKQWRVTIVFAGVEVANEMSFYINDDHFTNVLRKLAEIQFDNNPVRVSITEVKHEQIGSPLPPRVPDTR